MSQARIAENDEDLIAAGSAPAPAQSSGLSLRIGVRTTRRQRRAVLAVVVGFGLLAAACLIAAPVAAGELRGAQSAEFSSQGVYIGTPGVGVRVGPERDRWRERRHWREREVRGEGCKTVTVRETRPDGSTVTRTRSRC